MEQEEEDGGGTHVLAFAQRWPARQRDVEQVQFLVAVLDGAVFVDPQERVFDLGLGFAEVVGGGDGAGLVDAHVDGEPVRPRCVLQAQQEGRLVGGKA